MCVQGLVLALQGRRRIHGRIRDHAQKRAREHGERYVNRHPDVARVCDLHLRLILFIRMFRAAPSLLKAHLASK